MKNNDEEIKKRIEKKVFTNSSFIETQIWMCSSFTAVSLAFFFSLLGANEHTEKQLCTDIAIYTYSLSLVTNACIVFIFSIFRDDGNLIHELNLSKKFSYIIFISWISFISSIILTVGIFSIKGMIFILIIAILIIGIFKKVQKEIDDEHKKSQEKELEEIINAKLY